MQRCHHLHLFNHNSICICNLIAGFLAGLIAQYQMETEHLINIRLKEVIQKQANIEFSNLIFFGSLIIVPTKQHIDLTLVCN